MVPVLHGAAGIYAHGGIDSAGNCNLITVLVLHASWRIRGARAFQQPGFGDLEARCSRIRMYGNQIFSLTRLHHAVQAWRRRLQALRIWVQMCFNTFAASLASTIWGDSPKSLGE